MLVLLGLFGQVMESTSLYTSFGFDSQPKLVGLILFSMTIYAPVEHVLAFAMVRPDAGADDADPGNDAADLGAGRFGGVAWGSMS